MIEVFYILFLCWDLWNRMRVLSAHLNHHEALGATILDSTVQRVTLWGHKPCLASLAWSPPHNRNSVNVVAQESREQSAARRARVVKIIFIKAIFSLLFSFSIFCQAMFISRELGCCSRNTIWKKELVFSFLTSEVKSSFFLVLFFFLRKKRDI